MVPDSVRERWEAAYREYAWACARADQSTSDCDRDTARVLAAASRKVATAWRELRSAGDLPWWVAAAVMTAAEALECQARDWDGRAERATGAKPAQDVPTVAVDPTLAPTEPIPTPPSSLDVTAAAS